MKKGVVVCFCCLLLISSASAQEYGGALWARNIGSTCQRYPLHFSVFSFWDISGIHHSQGPIAAHYDVDLLGFNVNDISSLEPCLDIGVVAGETLRQYSTYESG